MAAFVPCANGLNVKLDYTSGGDINENVFWVHNSAAWDAAGIKTMLDAFIAWWGTTEGGTSYKDLCSSDVSLVSVSGRDNTTQHGLVVVDQAGLPIAGTGSTPQIQLGCTKSFTARTGLAGKSYRGRVFAVGVPANQADAPDIGTVKAAYANAMVQALNDLIDDVTAAIGTCQLVVCSRYYQPGGPGTKSQPRAAGIMTPITTFGFHDLNVDFQRRRAPGHSRHG